MKLDLGNVVFSSDNVQKNITIELLAGKDTVLDLKAYTAYAPFINAHDHLIGNWYPKADGPGRPYINSHLWVEEMKTSDSFKDRSKVWHNDGSFNLLVGESKRISIMGMYKNLFSGVGLVQDHAPKQADEYYAMFPIKVLKEYTQCHSLTLGNWWGGKSAVQEWKDSKGKLPFILHLGEGLDTVTRNEFSKLKTMGLLKDNVLMIHGISLTEDELKEIAEAGASVCWCPVSNDFLIGKTAQIEKALEFGVNICLATDSSMTGGINILDEFRKAHQTFPNIPFKTLYDMISKNALKALMQNEQEYALKEQTKSILITKTKVNDPFENILELTNEDIELFVLDGKPLYGNEEFLSTFDVNTEDYFTFETEVLKEKKFVIGHPETILKDFNNLLGYSKDFPYIPFVL